MTDLFYKFFDYSHIDKNGNRVINTDAPNRIKEEAKRLDNDHFNKTGRHMIIVE